MFDKITIGFQGEQGSFSEEALIKYFGEETDRYNVSEFEDLFEALQNNKIDYGVLPIENSSTGGIAEVYDLLRKYNFYIIGEISIKIEHNLLAVRGTKIKDIQEVYSHPQAYKQSSIFFKDYPQLKFIPYKNTATSAKLISKENIKTKAAIASKNAAQIYDLDIIKANINHNKNNYTRFIIIGKDLRFNDKSNKISIVVTTLHKPGELYKIISYFAKYNLNMLKIESRPILGKSWEYFFYIDFEGNLKEKYVKEAIKLIQDNSLYFKLLGNYEGYVI